jgi:hypothetical protein
MMATLPSFLGLGAVRLIFSPRFRDSRNRSSPTADNWVKVADQAGSFLYSLARERSGI